MILGNDFTRKCDVDFVVPFLEDMNDTAYLFSYVRVSSTCIFLRLWWFAGQQAAIPIRNE
jgi:hypothetical protein